MTTTFHYPPYPAELVGVFCPNCGVEAHAHVKFVEMPDPDRPGSCWNWDYLYCEVIQRERDETL